jgi:hypothetical protein
MNDVALHGFLLTGWIAAGFYLLGFVSGRCSA